MPKSTAIDLTCYVTADCAESRRHNELSLSDPSPWNRAPLLLPCVPYTASS